MSGVASIRTRRSAPCDVRHARNAIYLTFALNGFAFANWAARVPAVRDILRLSPGQVGLLLLCISFGSLGALPLTGMVVARVGPAIAIAGGVLVHCAGLTTAGIGAGLLTSPPLVAVGLVCGGAGISVWDVAMNVSGADVEQRLGVTVMPRFHAAFSLGTVAGAGTGALASGQGLPLQLHLPTVAVLVLVVGLVTVRWVLPARQTQRGATRGRHALRAWLEPRTVLVGVFTLALALTEGSANDWLGLAMVDGYHTSQAVGATGYAAFVAAMTGGRVVGSWLLDRFGRIRVLLTSIAAALAGVLLFVGGLSLALAFVGAAVWGLGTALGFPVGMSAAADDPTHAASRVSVVSSIAYTAFLAGPPVIGLLGDHIGTLHALVAVVVALAVACVAVAAVRPPATATADVPG